MIDLTDTILLALVVGAEGTIAQNTLLDWECILQVWIPQPHSVMDVA
jgi:hypothetical protein